MAATLVGRDRLGLSSHIRTFSGMCELSVLDVHDVSGIINDSHAFLGRDDIEALLKEVLERPTPDKLAYSSALPCAMFTAPEHAVGHFIYICSSALTLSNGCKMHETARLMKWKKSSSPSAYKCRLIKDAQLLTQIAVGTPTEDGGIKCSARISWIAYNDTTSLTVSTGIYLVQIRPSRALDARLEEAGPAPEGEDE